MANASISHIGDISGTTLTIMAIDRSGKVGSLYDACRDNILRQSTRKLKLRMRKISNRKAINSNLVFPDINEPVNLLRSIVPNKNIMLSLLLQGQSTTGIASLANYFHLTSKRTVLFQFAFLNHTEELQADQDMRPTQYSSFENATHIITEIQWGFEFLALFQLPSDNEWAKEIESQLKTLSDCFQNADAPTALSDSGSKILEQITYTKIFTDSPELRQVSKIHDIFQYLESSSKTITMYPLKYTIRPIEDICHPINCRITKFIPVNEENVRNIEDLLFPFFVDISRTESTILETESQDHSNYLIIEYNALKNQFNTVKEEFRNYIRKIFDIVIALRAGRTDNSMIKEIPFNDEKIRLKNDIDQLNRKLDMVKEKRCFITDLLTKNVEYLDVTKCNIDANDNNNSMKVKLLNNRGKCRVFCSTDELRKNRKEMFANLMQDLLSNESNDQYVRMIYADFSNSSFSLSNITLIKPSEESTPTRIATTSDALSEPIKVSSSTTTKTNASNQQNVDSSNVKFIIPLVRSKSIVSEDSTSILLLGEIGVGKSTFINAFANYLKFNSLTEAEQGRPAVIIPVSFMITVGDHFDERIVKFGEQDDSNNEDFDHPGQSVTQHCKSYVFHLNDRHRTKVRIIDTPGFGDTRGVEQDERNMEHILEYVNNLTHLNAVCFLLESNASRLSVFFRTCITQLFSLLSASAYDNIVFCFTNSRSTFYSPGDRAPLLRKMLNSLSIGNVPFKKENTFCFDNESFRYLVALRNGIRFNGIEREAYEASWKTSVAQSNRFIDYILRNLFAYRINRNIPTMAGAAIRIRHLIGPILESIRGILRNLILYRINGVKYWIKVSAKSNPPFSTCCSNCMPSIDVVGRFRIRNDRLHTLKKGVCECKCAGTFHIKKHYLLAYEYLPEKSSSSEEKIVKMLKELLRGGAIFVRVLQTVGWNSKDDPFANGLAVMIIEEKDLGNYKTRNHMNYQLAEELEKCCDQYKHEFDDIAMNTENIELSDVYNWIEKFGNYPMIKVQLNALNEALVNEIQEYELEV